MSTLKQKLTSRKFWAAVVEFVSMLILAFGGNENEATRVAAIIMAGAGVVAYIVGEGLVDAAAANPTVTISDAVSSNYNSDAEADGGDDF